MAKKSAASSLLEQLSKVATDGPAGAAQATRAKAQKPDPPKAAEVEVESPTARKSPAPKVKPSSRTSTKPTGTRLSGPKGKTVSCYLHHDELSALDSLGARLTLEKGTTANRTHLLRAGIRAVSQLSLQEVAEIVEEGKLLDGRKTK